MLLLIFTLLATTFFIDRHVVLRRSIALAAAVFFASFCLWIAVAHHTFVTIAITIVTIAIAVITFAVAVVTFAVAVITLAVAVVTFAVAVITFTVALVTVAITVVTFTVALVTVATFAPIAVTIAIITIATIILTAIVTTFTARRGSFRRFLFFFFHYGGRLRLFNRLLFSGEHFLQATQEAANQTGFVSGRGCGRLRDSSWRNRRFRLGLVWCWRCIRHHESGQSRLLRAFALGVFFFRRQRHLGFMQLWQMIAERLRLFAAAHAQHGIMRSLHLIVRHDDRAHTTLAFFDGAHRFTFFIQQIRCNLYRNDRVNFFGVLFQRFFFNQTQNRERQRFVITDGAGAATARADVMTGFAQRRAEALTRHLKQAETGDMANLDTSTILTHGLTQAVFYRALMANRRHIDKVDNNQAAQITQAQLAGNFICRFQVGIEGRFFDITAAGRACGVNIDGGQRFSGIDNDRAAGRQTHFTLEGRLNLRFDLVMAEQRDFAGVKLNFATEIRTTQCGDMLASQLQHFRVIDKDFADILTQIVTESANDNVTFLMDQERSRAAVSGLFNGFPMFHAEAQVPLQRFGGLANACGTYDQTHAFR